MTKSTTAAGVALAAIVVEAWQQVGASFKRFCLTAGIATLAGMTERDAARLWVRHGPDDGRDGCRWGGPRESWASTRARSSWSDRGCGPVPAAR
jgi:putative transposase